MVERQNGNSFLPKGQQKLRRQNGDISCRSSLVSLSRINSFNWGEIRHSAEKGGKVGMTQLPNITRVSGIAPDTLVLYALTGGHAPQPPDSPEW